jgi:hypothetical protein
MGSKNVYKLLHHCRLNAVHINDKSQNKKFFSNCNQELDGPEEEEENVFFFFFSNVAHELNIERSHLWAVVGCIGAGQRDFVC